jgi:hypothetical protein
MEASLTVVYTHRLRGDLALLPRLYSFIRQLRAHYSEEAVTLCPLDPAPANPTGKILLLDLGESCAPDLWHCAVTGGRSTLVVLDSMGYDAANVTGFFAPESREKMGDMLRIALVDDEHRYETDDLVIAIEHRRGVPLNVPTQNRITVILDSSDITRFEHNILSLAGIEGGQIGVARICTKKIPYELEEHTIFDLPRQMQPDPTIAGIVDFVISEARHTQKRQQT